MVLFGFSLLPAGKPGRDEIENTTPTITIIPIITDIVATNLTEGISSLHSRSEEHTSELQSQSNLVCRLLLEKKKTKNYEITQGPQNQGRSSRYKKLLQIRCGWASMNLGRSVYHKYSVPVMTCYHVRVAAARL